MQGFRNLLKRSDKLVGRILFPVQSSSRLLHLSKWNCDNCDDPIEKNPYFEKYANKIKKAQVDGVYSPPGDEMNERLRRETQEWKQGIAQAEQSLQAKKEKQSSSRGSKLPTKLDELIHVELFENKTNKEISQIWTEYFKSKDAISAAIPSDMYDVMREASESNPMFLYPLPKDHGYEFILSQFEGNRCFFTSLINYQVHDANAPWQLCLTFYTELKDTKGVVLMASEIDLNAMNTLEAQCLAQLQQMFYANSVDVNKSELLKTFNHNPDAFKYMDLVHEIESSNIVVKPTM